MKKYIAYIICLIFLFSGGFGVSTAQSASSVKNKVSIPKNAKKVADGIFYLGKKLHQGKAVEGYAYIHYKKSKAKPETSCGNGVCEPGENARKCPADCGDSTDQNSTCYGFLSKGAKWKTNEPYLVNPSNSQGLSQNSVTNNLSSSIDKWEEAAGFDILGSGSSTVTTLSADLDSPDNVNEVYFGDIEEVNAIGVTIVWGIFGGPPRSRELVEWDQVYDEVDYNWSDSGEAGKMDFANIAIHELGHSVGMKDLYTNECSEQTMYGYADYGETKKQSLEAGDIAGIKKLY